MRLVDEKNHLEYLLSPKSLRLHEEYQARILVLQELGYIDNENLGKESRQQFCVSIEYLQINSLIDWFQCK